MLVKLIIYSLLSYGIANMMIYGEGPFGIFEYIRKVGNNISESLGHALTCFMCLPTWIGFSLSLIDYALLPTISFTPFNMVFENNDMWYLIIAFDGGATSAICWLLHQLDELLEKISEHFTDYDE